MLTGETDSGSRAANQSVDARETLRHNALAEDIVTLENFGIAGLPSLITELVSLNFPTVKLMPYLCFKESGTSEALKNASVFADLVSKQVIHVFASDELKIREQLGFDDTVTEADIQAAIDEEKAAEKAAVDAKANAEATPKQTPEAVKPTEGEPQ
jgi:hypothetical protein